VHGAVFVAGDEAAGFIEAHAELAAMQRGLVDELAVLPLVAMRPVGAVQPVVDAAAQAVGGVLRIAADAHGADLRAFVAAQIAVFVGAEPQLRRLLQQDAAFHEGEAAGHDQLVEEDGALVGLAVAVFIGEHDDAADGIALAAALHVAHVALILDDPDAPLGIELKEDRALHHRLAGDEFRAVTGRELEGLRLLLRRKHRRGRDLDAFEQVPRPFPNPPSQSKPMQAAHEVGRREWCPFEQKHHFPAKTATEHATSSPYYAPSAA
jgi:hypothetical protein